MTSIIGRRRELERIEGAVRRGLSGTGTLLLLSGEPGIGKTLLSDHAADGAARGGATVAWGRCWEAGGAPAYWPWIEVFRAVGEEADPFFPSESGESPADARFRSFDLVVRKIIDVARRRPLAILLDDLHAADVPSLLVLSLLVRGLRGVPIVIVGTYRDAEARGRREVGPLLAKIAREGEVLSLAPLEPGDIVDWLGRDGGDASRAAEVYRLTEGNPLFVQEILRLGDSNRASRLPDGLSAVLDEHLSRVSPATRTVLECGAVLGREFSPAYAGLLAGVAATAVSAALAEAEAAALVSPISNDRRSFVHMLVRDRLVETMAPSRYAELHCKAGEAILAARADLVSAAHHYIEGHAAAPIDRVLGIARDAAERALSSLAFEGAAELGERALALVSDRPPTHESCALAVVVAEAHLRAGSMAVGKERCIEGARIARELGASDLLARAALAYGAHFSTATVDPTMVALLEDALAALEDHDHPIRARVMARLAAALVPPRKGDGERVESLARDSVAMARRLGDPDTLLYALLFATSALGYRVSVEERNALHAEVETLARKSGSRSTLVTTMAFRGALLLETGRRSEAEALFKEYESLLSDFPQPAYQWRKYVGRMVFASLDGDFDEVRRAGEEMRQGAESSGVQTARLAWALLQIAIAHAQGEPSSIEPRAEAVLELLVKMPPLLPYTAWVLAATGRTDEARDMLRRVTTEIEGFPWLIAAGDATVVLRDRELAERFYEPLAAHQYQNRMFWGPAGTFCLGPTQRTLGDLAMILGRHEDALRHYDDAIVVSERVGSKPLLALSRRGREAALAAVSRTARSPTIGRPSENASATGAPTLPRGDSRRLSLRREGDVWAIEQSAGPTIRVKDGKGLRYLERLLSAPGSEVHVLELAGIDEAPADAGAVLDAKAKDQYKERLDDLRGELDEAMRLCDSGRAERARAEIDAIAGELASAVGLGGRDRKAASNVERARVNVQRRLRDAIERISDLDPGLGRYLGAAIRTGTFCSFSPL